MIVHRPRSAPRSFCASQQIMQRLQNTTYLRAVSHSRKRRIVEALQHSLALRCSTRSLCTLAYVLW